MLDLWTQPWFPWAVAVIVGLPLLLIVLTEVNAALARRNSPAAKPVLFVRNFLLPVAALLILLLQIPKGVVDITWTRVVATVLGFLVILVLLSTVNVVVFGRAKPGTWRDRMPSIFIDLVRVLLIVVGLAVLFSLVWNADVGGLFAALGVTSIVIGFALQSAVGSVVSGLLLLFEQPFRLGDWLDTGSVRGRIVEVNWRAIHIDTGNGLQIVPNAELAGGSFTNLSRAVGTFLLEVPVAFDGGDDPHRVVALLRETGDALPQRVPDESCGARHLGAGAYRLDVPIGSPAEEDDTRSLLATWLWYASRRRGLHLAGAGAAERDDAAVEAALRSIAAGIAANPDELAALAPSARLERFGAGETVEQAGTVASGLRVVLDGVVGLGVVGDDGALLPVGEVPRGDYLAETALTRQRMPTRAVARTPLETLVIDVAGLDELVRRRPAVARELGRALEQRTAEARAARAAAKLPVIADRP